MSRCPDDPVGDFEHLAQVVRARRVRMDWTQADLATAAGVSETTIQNLEGQRVLTRLPNTMARIEEALGWPPDTARQIAFDRREVARMSDRTISLACPQCAVDVVCEPAKIADLCVGTDGTLVARIDVVGKHKCETLGRAGASDDILADGWRYRGWFADVDQSLAKGADYPWQPVLQLEGHCVSLNAWFATKHACLAYIHDEILGTGLITDRFRHRP